MTPQEPGYDPERRTYTPNPYFMRAAIWLGERAPRDNGSDQHPIGAVVTGEFVSVQGKTFERVIHGGQNGTQLTVGHAEIMALSLAETQLGRDELKPRRAVMYTTHEPCPMCAHCITSSRLLGVVSGTTAADASRLVETENIQWRSSQVSGIDVIQGREETSNRPHPFIIPEFLRDECYALLATSPKAPQAQS